MILCRKTPTLRDFSSALRYPPKQETSRPWREVSCVLLAVCLAPVLSFAQQSAAQTSIGDVYASDAAVKGDVRQTSSGLEVSNGSVITAGEHSATLRLARGG